MRRNALGGAVLSLILAAGALAQERAVWQVGEFDNSSSEFDASTAQGAFVISESRPKDWGATQQAVPPGRVSETAARRIRFNLADAPRGTFTLELGLIVLTPRLPIVQLNVNGHTGWFHQRPEDYEEGNVEGSILPQYAIGTMSVPVPAEYLRQGANEISLTAVTDPLSTGLPGGEVMDDAALTYDALALVQKQQAAAAPVGVLSAEAKPTVFYKRAEGGRVNEVVSVLVSWRGLAPGAGSVTLSVGGWSGTQDLSSERDFGEQRLEFLVPEFAGGSKANVNVKANGRSYDFSQQLRPARKWTVYLVPHEHLDVGYSDFQQKLAELHSRVVNEAMELSGERPEFKFSLDGYWQAQQFLEGRTPAEQQKFFAAVRGRKLFVPAQHSVMLTGFPVGETLIRSFYASHKFNREHGGPWDYVNITDVPSYSWSYASIISAAGLKYFAAAANADRGPTLMLGDLHRRSPFWWEGPDGSRVLMWYARHYHQIRSEFGLPPVVATGYEGLQSFLKVYERPDYTPDAVLLYGSQWENTSLYPQQAALVRDWHNLFAYPELKFAGFGEALAQIAARAKGELPVVRGDGGPFWEDGIASDALYAGLERESERRALSAEKLATVASLVDTRTLPSRRALDEMWDNIFLMNEHTWGWGRSVTEPDSEDSTRELQYKRLAAMKARDSVEYLLERAMTAIAGKIETPSRALVVFNTLNWERDGWVEFDLQKTRELVNVGTGKTVAFEALEDHPAYQRIRFLAQNVPAVGYKTYAVRDRTTVAPSPAAQPDRASPGVMENSFYRVALDPRSGAVRAIYDKQLARELVDASSPFRFNQYVYVTGGDEFPNQLLTYRKWSPVARLETHGAGEGRLISITRTPDAWVARLESSSVNTPRISTEIILHDKEKKIEFINRVRKDEVYKKEAAYFAFPLAIREPRFRYEVQNGAVDPARDMIPGAGLEWFSSQNWVSASGQGVTVQLVNKEPFLWTFGDVVRGTWPKEFGKKPCVLFSYVMNNYWNTNYVAAQWGDFTFRYTLTSAAALDDAQASRLGWEETTPLERTLVKSQDKTYPFRNTLPAAGTSFLQVDSPAVFLSTWKRAEEGGGSVLRFIELGGVPARVSIKSPLLDSASAEACNAVEECGQTLQGGPGGLNFQLRPRQIYTLRARGVQEHASR